MIGNVTALDPDYKIGDVVLPTDQINLSCRNPTIGRNIDTWGMRFYDCSKIYSKDNVRINNIFYLNYDYIEAIMH